MSISPNNSNAFCDILSPEPSKSLLKLGLIILDSVAAFAGKNGGQTVEGGPNWEPDQRASIVPSSNKQSSSHINKSGLHRISHFSKRSELNIYFNAVITSSSYH